MAVVIQLGMMGELPRMCVGKRWLVVPHWVAVEWQQTGTIRQIIHDWQGGILMKYRAHPCESEALDRIEDEAKALYRYFKRGHLQHYYNILGDVHRRALEAERRVMYERPSLKGRLKYEYMAERMGREFTWFQAKMFLDEATDMLVIDQQRRELRNLAKLAREIIAGNGELEQAA